LHPSKKYTVIKDVCYDITDFSERHPGGKHLIALAVGRDASILFDSYHVTDRPYKYLKSVPQVGKVGDEKVAKILASYKMRGSEWKQIPESFPQPNTSDLYQRMKKRINEEILAPRGRTSGRGGPVMVATSFLIPMTWACLQAWYIVSPSVVSGFWLGMCGVWIGVALQHTANHGALLSSGSMNQVIGYTADVGIGVSSLVWRFHHQVSHHVYTNDDYLDLDAYSSKPVIRLDSAQELKWWHKYQHLYAWPLFALLYPAKQQSDTTNLCLRSADMVKFLGASDYEVPLAVTLKIVHFFLMLFIPHALHGDVYVWGPAFASWMLSGGVLLSWLFIVSHNIGEAKVDAPRETPDWCRQQIEHSASWGGHFGCLMTGGLNLQVEHHLFPGVSHDLYSDIQVVVKEECAKEGVHYAGYDTLFEITSELLSFMKRMGSEERPDFSGKRTAEENKKASFFKTAETKKKQ
jgi:fatty acid desaturase (delta-4 desaturase)